MSERKIDLPAPPYSEHVDLSGLDYMPLLVRDLGGSRFWAKCDRRPELAYYGVNIWKAAWGNVPAGSLENDDDVLRAAAKCPPDKWADYRADILAHFVLHSDGRLYHSTLVKQVRIALVKREHWRTKKRQQRATSVNVPLDMGGDTQGDSAGTSEGNRVTTTTTIDDESFAAAGEVSKGSPTGQAVDTQASAVVECFLSLRKEKWPAESRLPAPGSTLLTVARQWIGEGCSVEFARHHMARVMVEKLERGESAPSDLRFCGLSLRDALARQRNPRKANGKPTAPPQRPKPTAAEIEETNQRLFDAAMAKGRAAPAAA